MKLLKTISDRIQENVIPPKLLLGISLFGLLVVSILVILEYQDRQKDLLRLLENQSHMFISTLSSSAQNAYNAAQQFESEMNSRILSSLSILERLDRQTRLTRAEISEIVKIAHVDEIHIYGTDGATVLRVSSHETVGPSIPRGVLKPRMKAYSEMQVFSLDDYPRPGEERMVFLVPRAKGGVLAALMTRERIGALRNLLGFGYFLKRFRASENVEYIVLQNTETIVAGSFSGYTLSSFSVDSLLGESLARDTIRTRILDYDGHSIYEAVSRFSVLNVPAGVLRLGLSMKEYQQLATSARDRLYVLAAVLFVIGLVFVNFMISYKHRYLLRRDLAHLREYTNFILDNLQSGVVTIDQEGNILTANRQALSLLDKRIDRLYRHSYSVLPGQFHSAVKGCLNADQTLSSNDRTLIQWKNRSISLRTNSLWDSDARKTCILLLDDVTQQVRFEEQVRKNERLTAMQNLASAVAHEIRNPLNSIRLIIDFIKKNIRRVEGAGAFDQKLESVQKEITRISAIVEQYLRFGRMPELNMTPVKFPELLRDTASLVEVQLEGRRISLVMDIQDHPAAMGDRDQIKQVLINVIRNAEEATTSGGSIRITGSLALSFYEVRIADTGKGIHREDLSSIFDLNFTTKTGGSGLGLVIAKQIMTAHHGSIEVESEEGKGTSVLLRFPLGQEDHQHTT